MERIEAMERAHRSGVPAGLPGSLTLASIAAAALALLITLDAVSQLEASLGLLLVCAGVLASVTAVFLHCVASILRALAASRRRHNS